MDKKNYQQFCGAKPPSTDSKKSQDVNGSKQFPKSSRKREPSRANNFSKNDQPRRSNTQKTKTFDKRPKPKGQYHGCSKENSKVVENEAELGSVMVQGSKKQNINVNFLVNFQLPPRNVQSWWNHDRSRGYGSHNYRWLPSVQRHKYNKEQFLQANCQFVVTANGDYSQYLIDPDILVDWKMIQQIRVQSSENLSCPICLYPPIAGKMTRCGHIYCWSCILHYLSFSEKPVEKIIKCPICFESVHKNDLKSVNIQFNENTLNVGDDITLRLMRREKGSLIAVSVGENDSSPPSQFLSISDKSCQQVYSKLLLAQNEDIMNIIHYERDQLVCELMEDPDSPKNPFIEQALNELLDREKLLFETAHQNNNKFNQSNAREENILVENQDDPTHEKVEYEDEDEEHDLSDNICNSILQSSDDLNTLPNDIGKSTELQKFHYFYQADNGQNVYLHAMNVKMLEMQFGSLEASPLTISGKILEKEVGSYTEDLRRRMRYLCHLPLTSQFELVEIDLQSIVSDDVLKSFQDQINRRQRQRKKRDKEEKKREKKITEEENKRMGKYPTPNIHLESHKDFPEFQPDIDEFYVPSPPESVVTSSIASSPSISAFDEIASTAGGGNNNNWPSSSSQGPSFAQMLQNNGSKKTVAWPSLSTVKKVEPMLAASNNEQSTDNDPEMEEYMAPINCPNLGDAVAQAFQKKIMLNQENSSIDNVAGKKKKKKAKATVLFATNMARAS